MEINIIPNIYEAFRAPPPQIAVQTIFPSAATRTLTQIAYYLKRQQSLGEQVVERAREQRFEALSMTDLTLGKTLRKKGLPSIRYKFVVPNQIGFPIIGISSDIQSVNAPIANALGVPNFNSRAMNAMRQIYAPEVPITYTAQDQRTNIITRPDVNGFPVKIYITKFLR